MKKDKKQKGAVVLLYITLMTIITLLFLIVAQSQYMLSLRRNLASSDTLLAGYQAESDVNDFLARLIGGFILESDLTRPGGISFSRKIGGTDILIQAFQSSSGSSTTQTVRVTAKRAFAVSAIEAIRSLNATVTEPTGDVEIALIIDCTESMNQSAGGSSSGSRFDLAKIAATESFLEQIMLLPGADKYHVGLGVFGLDALWVNASWAGTSFSNAELKPNSGQSLDLVNEVIKQGLPSHRPSNSFPGICKSQNYTSIGSGYALTDNYFKNESTADRRVTVLITDGVPNSRAADPSCPPGGECKNCTTAAMNYFRCALADVNTTYMSGQSYLGLRDPSNEAYGITIFNDVDEDVEDVFTTYGTPGGYFNATNASELPALLKQIFDIIVTTSESYTIRRVIPGN